MLFVTRIIRLSYELVILHWLFVWFDEFVFHFIFCLVLSMYTHFKNVFCTFSICLSLADSDPRYRYGCIYINVGYSENEINHFNGPNVVDALQPFPRYGNIYCFRNVVMFRKPDFGQIPKNSAMRGEECCLLG